MKPSIVVGAARAACAAAVFVALTVPAAFADAPRPASVLVFAVQQAGPADITLLSVTNTDTSFDGATRALFRYVTPQENPQNPLVPFDCGTLFRAEHLTPADTVTVVTRCHSGSAAKRGYVVVSAQNPTTGAAWAHDHLIGSALVISFGSGLCYSIQPFAFEALAADGAPTEADFDGRLDFNGIEYEQLPDDLHVDSFVASAAPRLSLLSMHGDPNSLVTVNMSIWNDNEFPLSLSFQFRCWFDVPLPALSAVFTQQFLHDNTPDDSQEVDVDCNGKDDYESGWIRIRAATATGFQGTVPNPPLLGALGGGVGAWEGGRQIWGSHALSNGQF